MSLGKITFAEIIQTHHNTNWQQNLADFLNSLPNRTPILAYTVKCAYGSLYCNLPATSPSPALINAFHSFGSTKIDSLQDSTLMIFFGRKGVGSAHEGFIYQ